MVAGGGTHEDNLVPGMNVDWVRAGISFVQSSIGFASRFKDCVVLYCSRFGFEVSGCRVAEYLRCRAVISLGRTALSERRARKTPIGEECSHRAGREQTRFPPKAERLRFPHWADPHESTSRETVSCPHRT